MTVPLAVEGAEAVGKAKAAKSAKSYAKTRPGKGAGVPKSTTENVNVTEKKSESSAPAKRSGKSNTQRAKSFKRSYMPHISPAKSTVRYRQILAAEIVVGLIVIMLEPTADGSDTDFAKAIERGAAYLIVFFILSVMTSAGPSGARVSATLGGVILLTLLLRPNNNFIMQKLIPPRFRTASDNQKVNVPKYSDITPLYQGQLQAGGVLPLDQHSQPGIPRSNSNGVAVGQPGGVNSNA